MNTLLLTLFSAAALNAQIISGITPSLTASTIRFDWNTNTASTSVVLCGTAHGGPYTLTAVDAGTQTSVTAHNGIIADLAVSTNYFCTVASGSTTSAEQPVTTTAEATSTPIVNAVWGKIFRNNDTVGGNYIGADTFNHATSNDGNTYFTAEDTRDTGGRCGVISPTSNSSFNVFTSLTTFFCNPVNGMTGWGAFATDNGDGHTTKVHGIYPYNGNLFAEVSRQVTSASLTSMQPHFNEYAGTIAYSADHGANWNSYTLPAVFTPTGTLNAPLSASMYTTPSALGSCGSGSWIMYGADDGSNWGPGRYHVHQSDAYAYIACNSGQWDMGTAIYIVRKPLAKLVNMDASDAQYYQGPVPAGAHDYAVAANWTATGTNAVSVLSDASRIGQPSVQYIPALGRYVMFSHEYPDLANNALCLNPNCLQNTRISTSEAPTPVGPWTIIGQTHTETMGSYGQVILNSTAITATATNTQVTVLSSADFSNVTNCAPGTSVRFDLFRVSSQCQYTLWTQSLTLETQGNQPYVSPIPITWGTNLNAIIGKNLAYATVNLFPRGGNLNSAFDLNQINPRANTVAMPMVTSTSTGIATEWSTFGPVLRSKTAYTGWTTGITTALTDFTIYIVFATDVGTPEIPPFANLIKKSSANSAGVQIFRNNGTANWVCGVKDNSSPFGIPVALADSTSSQLNWHLLVCRRNLSGVKVTVTGSAQAAGTVDAIGDGFNVTNSGIEGLGATDTNALSIGMDPGQSPGSSNFLGYIPVVLFYPGTVHLNREVCQNYQAIRRWLADYSISLPASTCSVTG